MDVSLRVLPGTPLPPAPPAEGSWLLCRCPWALGSVKLRSPAEPRVPLGPSSPAVLLPGALEAFPTATWLRGRRDGLMSPEALPSGHGGLCAGAFPLSLCVEDNSLTLPRGVGAVVAPTRFHTWEDGAVRPGGELT